MTNKNPNLYEATFYYALCNLLADFLHDKWQGHTMNVRKVKLLSNQLRTELEKSVDVLFDKSMDMDFGAIADQFINATNTMEDFFILGLLMDEIEDDKKVEMNKKINEIILHYIPDYHERR